MFLACVLLSEFTNAWLLYLGLVFLFMVMFASGGFASLIMMNVRIAAFERLNPLLAIMRRCLPRARWLFPEQPQ